MEITNVAHQITLKETLSPLWKTSYYCGFLFDWCHSIRHPGIISISIRWICIFFVMSLLFFFSFLDAVRFCIDLTQQREGLVAHSVHFFPRLVALATQITFLVYRNNIINYFNDWSVSVERPKTISKRFGSVKRTSTIIYVIYCSFNIFHDANDSWIPIFDISNDLFGDFILTMSYFKENLWASLTYRATKFTTSLFSMVFFAIADLVPAFAYYHAALALDDLINDVESISSTIGSNQFTEGNKRSTDLVDLIQSYWSRFGAIRQRIRKADHIFGPLIIFNHGTLFFAICGTFHDLTESLLNNTASVMPIMLLSLVTLISRLFLGVSIMMKVFSFANQLEITLADFLSTHWNTLNENEHRILSSFMSELQNSQLAVSPSSLYNIKPSIFLSMLSLMITYTIILLTN